MFTESSITSFSLRDTGLVALADLPTISNRTALKGSASFLDVLFLAPGIHRQNVASDVNGWELSTAGAMNYQIRIPYREPSGHQLSPDSGKAKLSRKCPNYTTRN
jgi:hypothetical protein